MQRSGSKSDGAPNTPGAMLTTWVEVCSPAVRETWSATGEGLRPSVPWSGASTTETELSTLARATEVFSGESEVTWTVCPPERG